MSIYKGTQLISGVATPVQGARNIGQIIPSTIPLTDAGLHLLDGALIQGSGIYSAFVTYIAGLVTDYPSLFCTEAQWQTSVNTYGVCGKFVYDSVNNTVRLPKITGILEGTTDVNALGALVEAGLPNITGTFSPWAEEDRLATGAFYVAANNQPGTNSHGDNDNTLFGFDASRSSSIYGNSSTVQPQTIKCYYYIVIATSTKTDIQVDIDNIATDLNGKADVDLTNCTKPHIVETYVNGTSWYRVYSDRWCEQGGANNSGNIGGWQTVYFAKPYSNTNYYVSVVEVNSTQRNFNIDGTNSGYFRYEAISVVGNKVRWYACGYIR